MSDKMLICRACLATNVSLFNIHDKDLTETFTNLMGISISTSDGVPPYICSVCSHLIRKFKKYRDKCDSSLQILHSIILKNELSIDQINNMERKDIFNLHQTITEIISIEPTEPAPDNMLHIDVVEASSCLKTETNKIEIKIKNEPNLSNDDETGFDEHSMVNTYEAHDMLKTEENVFDEDNTVKSGSDKNFYKEVPIENTVVINRKRKIEAPETKNVAKDKKPTKGKPKDTLTEMSSLSDILREVDKILGIKKKRTRVVKKEPTEEEKEYVKNSKLYYNNKTPNKNVCIKRMKDIDEFAKKYNYEIKYLTKEEQRKEIEDRKVQMEDMPYQCKICYQGYRKKDSYDTHMQVHDLAAGNYECDICNIRVKTKNRLNQHFRNRHCIQFTCKLCEKAVKNITAGREHHAIHGEARYSCDMCDKTFKRSVNYYDHLRNIHKKDAVNCPICRLTFRGEGGVTVHMNKKHRRAVRCNTCSLFFDTKSALIKHLEKSTDGACAAGVKACNYCGEGFSTDEEFAEHFQFHGYDFNTCVRCNEAFETPRALDNHLDKSHSSGRTGGSAYKPRAKSTQPRAPYGSKKRYNYSKPRFVCEVCGKELLFRHQLVKHMRLHTGEKPYKCTYCPKAFRLNLSLQMHELMHTDERPHPCTLCDSAFRQTSHLRAHMKVHTREKPYTCDICNKAFTESYNVREHKRTVHEGQPPRRRNRDKLRTVKLEQRPY